MAPKSTHRLRNRGLDTNMSSTIAISVFAGVLVAVAFFAACVWPRILRDSYKRRSSGQKRTKVWPRHVDPFDPQLSHDNSRPFTFPSHPAVRRNSRKMYPEPRLRIYNPHIGNSIHSQTESDKPLELSSLPPVAMVVPRPGNISYRGRNFIPDNSRHDQKACIPPRRSVTLPFAGSEYNRPKSRLSDFAFGDAKEYILAVPEPLLLRNPSPGIQTLPIMLSNRPSSLNTNSSWQTLHPGQRSQLSSIASQQHSQRSNTTIGATEQNTEGHYFSLVSDNNASEYLHGDGPMIQLGCKNVSDAEVRQNAIANSTSSSVKAPNTDDHNKTLTALTRLKTYRSLTGARPPQPLTRAGTVTRPKTPVAQIRNMYDKTPSRDVSGPLSQAHSISAEDFTDTSDFNNNVSTAHTSFEVASSSFALFSGTSRSDVKPTMQKPKIDHKTFADLGVSDPGLTDTTEQTIQSENLANNAKALHERKTNLSTKYPRSSILNLASSIPVATRRSKIVRPVSSMGSMLVPLMQPQDRRGSSIYSRDTKGHSIVNAPGRSTSVYSSDQLDHSLTTSMKKEGEGILVPMFQDNEMVEEEYLTDHPHTSKADDGSSVAKDCDSSPSAFALKQALTRKQARHQPFHVVHNHRDTQSNSVISSELNSADMEAILSPLPRIGIADDDDTGHLLDKPTEVQLAVQASSPRSLFSSSSSPIRGYAPGGAQWL